MLPFPPSEEKPSRPSSAERAAERDYKRWHAADGRDRGDDWGPFRIALGLVVVGGLLVLGSGVFLFLYLQMPHDPVVSPGQAVGPTAALVIATCGLIGLVLMGTGLVLTHTLPEDAGLRNTSKACTIALLGTLVVAVVLVHALVTNEMAGSRWDAEGLPTPRVQPWSSKSLLLLWLATYLLLCLTMVLWLVLLAQVARHFRCFSLAGMIYLFLGMSVLLAVINVLLVAAGDNDYGWHGPTRYAAGFMVEDDAGIRHSNVVVVSTRPGGSPVLAWGRALIATGMMVVHQLLVLLVRRATFAAAGPAFAEVTPAEIPSDWRWDRSQPGD